MSAEEPVVALAVAVAENGVIGREGGMPWHIRSELRHFRRVTMGKPLIMGRKTFASLGKPLDGRDNIILTRDPHFDAAGADIVNSAADALALARDYAEKRGASEIMVIGGAEIYRLMMPAARRVYLTRVHGSPDGDTRFPALGKDDWRLVSSEEVARSGKDDHDYTLMIFERI